MLRIATTTGFGAAPNAVVQGVVFDATFLAENTVILVSSIAQSLSGPNGVTGGGFVKAFLFLGQGSSTCSIDDPFKHVYVSGTAPTMPCGGRGPRKIG